MNDAKRAGLFLGNQRRYILTILYIIATCCQILRVVQNYHSSTVQLITPYPSSLTIFTSQNANLYSLCLIQQPPAILCCATPFWLISVSCFLTVLTVLSENSLCSQPLDWKFFSKLEHNRNLTSYPHTPWHLPCQCYCTVSLYVSVLTP